MVVQFCLQACCSLPIAVVMMNLFTLHEIVTQVSLSFVPATDSHDYVCQNFKLCACLSTWPGTQVIRDRVCFEVVLRVRVQTN